MSTNSKLNETLLKLLLSLKDIPKSNKARAKLLKKLKRYIKENIKPGEPNDSL